MAKTGDPALPSVLRGLMLGLRALEGLARAAMPHAADAMAGQIGLPPVEKWDQIGSLSTVPPGAPLGDPQPLFPRLEPIPQEESQDEAALEPPKPKEKKTMPEAPEFIDFEDFIKVRLRIGRVLDAEEMPKSAKLLKLKVQVGGETRQILAGIKASYSPEDMIGRQVVIAANLRPRKMMGEESQGMILAADDEDGSPILLQPEREAPEGTDVH
jgi:methionyl-tRNA synthetase